MQSLASSYEVADQRLCVGVAGLDFSSPVGLTAGYDKDCEMLAAMMSLGFGYIVGGTAMFGSHSGNPSPRLVRLPPEESLINTGASPAREQTRSCAVCGD